MAYQFGYPETKPVGTGGTGTLFAGKRCFITGASSGIGFGLAQRLLERGAEVWISSRNEGRIRAAFEKLSSFGPVHFAALDVCDGDAIERYLNEMAASGPIDYVFANAGVSTAHAFEKTTRQAFYRIMEPNFYGVFYTDQAAIPHLLRQGHGHILNVSSMEGYFANGYHSAYIASKFAVFGLTESLRYEYADRGLRFSVICPGPVVSNIWGRDAEGNIHAERKAPPESLTEVQAADEILAGIEEERNIILVTDTARTSWQKLRESPASADRFAMHYTAANRAVAQYLEQAERQTN